MAITDGNGVPLAVHVASASPHEIKLVEATLDSSFAPTLPAKLLGDLAYDSDPLDKKLKEKYGVDLIAPHKQNRSKPPTQDGRVLRRFCRRWKVERFFAWLQNFRRLVTRWEYKESNFLGMLQLACILTLAHSYQYRGDAYAAINDFPHAIADYTEAIKRAFGGETILLSLKQIRALYPEYDHIADDVLLRRIHDLFWPQMDFTSFADSISKKTDNWEIGGLHELYQKRGDAYLRNNQFRAAVRDFARIFKGIPSYADAVDKMASSREEPR